MAHDIFVVDTSALISYFPEVFNDGTPTISQNSINILDKGFHSNEIKLIFPAAVFIEIFKKWFITDEDAERIKIEIFYRIKSQENMEIQPFDKEILENFILITDIESNHNFDNHDKQILAAAMAMQCPLITSDRRLIRYNNRKNVIPLICD